MHPRQVRDYVARQLQPSHARLFDHKGPTSLRAYVISERSIEGLGKQLYPDLNLWDTAHPFLEKWIRQRFHPRTLWRDFRYHSPEWMEKFPQVPHLYLNLKRFGYIVRDRLRNQKPGTNCT